jgi:hypothetical protein
VTVDSSEFRGLLVLQRGLDAPERYTVYHLEDRAPVPMRRTVVEPDHVMRLEPQDRLTAGDYLLEFSSGGTFASPQYSYLRVSAPTNPRLDLELP